MNAVPSWWGYVRVYAEYPCIAKLATGYLASESNIHLSGVTAERVSTHAGRPEAGSQAARQDGRARGSSPAEERETKKQPASTYERGGENAAKH